MRAFYYLGVASFGSVFIFMILITLQNGWQYSNKNLQSVTSMVQSTPDLVTVIEQNLEQNKLRNVEGDGILVSLTLTWETEHVDEADLIGASKLTRALLQAGYRVKTVVMINERGTIESTYSVRAHLFSG